MGSPEQRLAQLELINQRVKAMNGISNEQDMKLRVEKLRKELQTAKIRTVKSQTQRIKS